MATRLPDFLEPERDPFPELERIINQKFDSLIHALRGRREQLLTELRTLQENLKGTSLEIVNELRGLETSKTELILHCTELRGNVAKLEMEKSIEKLQLRISELREKLPSVNVELSCDTFKLEQDITNLGKIFVRSEKREAILGQIEYSKIKSPLFKASKFGSEKKQLRNPHGLCIDNSTDLVYIADTGNKRIQVWTLKGEYVNSFGERVLNYPVRCTLLNGALFVSDFMHNSIFKFRLSNYSVLARSDYHSKPHGIDSDADKLFVISNYNVIAVFNAALSCLNRFSGRICECYDLKVRNSTVYLLEFNENLIKLLDSSTGDLVKTVITNKDSVHFENACSLCLDWDGNLLITNWKTSQIKIITGDGIQLRLIEWKLSKPMGIEVSRSNNIVLVLGTGMFCVI